MGEETKSVTVICTACRKPIAVLSAPSARVDALTKDPRDCCDRCDATVRVELSENAKTHIWQLVDYHLQFLEEIVDVLDAHLGEIDANAEGHPDPDGWGFFDRAEYAAGLGFVACQNYLTYVVSGEGKAKDLRGSVTDAERKRLLALGPKHSAVALSIAEIVHAAGNFAKHHSEFMHERNKAVLRTFALWREQEDRACDYPLANLLFKILDPKPARFGGLLALLEQWRDDVIENGAP